MRKNNKHSRTHVTGEVQVQCLQMSLRTTSKGDATGHGVTNGGHMDHSGGDEDHFNSIISMQRHRRNVTVNKQWMGQYPPSFSAPSFSASETPLRRAISSTVPALFIPSTQWVALKVSIREAVSVAV